MKKIGIYLFLGMLTLAAIKPVFSQPTIELDKIFVTVSRMVQYENKLAGNITIIGQEDIAASNAQTIPELLEEAEGVHVVNFSTSKTATVDLRGFGDAASRNVLVLINDRILNTVDISSPDLLQIPLSAVERIEIIRGAGSVLYGDRAVGGVVNIITKKGQGLLKGRIGTHYGSYDHRGIDMEVSGSKNKLSYFFYSNYDDDHGYRENSDVLRKDFDTRLGYEVGEKLSVDADYSFHEDHYGLPGGLSGTNLSNLGPRASTTRDDFAASRDNNLKLGFSLTPDLEDIYVGNLVLDLYLRDRDVFDSFAPNFNTSRGIRTTGATGKYIYDHEVFGKEVHFVSGLDFYDTENDIFGSGSNTDDLTITKTDLGLYSFGEYEAITDVFVNGGVRYYKAEYTFSQRNGVAVDEKQKPDDLVYVGGLKYEYGPGSNVHASVQKTFRFPATDEWYSSFSGTLNTDLQEQKGIQYEVGVKQNVFDITELNITPYLLLNEHEIFFDPSTFSNSNYDKTRRAGVEVGQETDLLKLLRIDFLDKLSLATNYTFQKPEFVGGPNDGKIIPAVPKQLVNARLLTHCLKHYDFSISGSYVGSQFATNDVSNTGAKNEPYFTLDTKIGYRLTNFEIYGEVNNVFDQSYSTILIGTGPQLFYPAPGRNFNVGMNIKF